MKLLALLIAELHFALPSGWLDVTPGRAAEDQKLTRQQVALMQKLAGEHQLHLLAVDPRDIDDDGGLMTVELRPAADPFTSDDLPKLDREGSVIERKVVRFGPTSALRGVLEGQRRRILVYIVPGSPHSFVLAYSTAKERFAEQLRRFEDSALATTGVEPSGWVRRSALRVKIPDGWARPHTCPPRAGLWFCAADFAGGEGTLVASFGKPRKLVERESGLVTVDGVEGRRVVGDDGGRRHLIYLLPVVGQRLVLDYSLPADHFESRLQELERDAESTAGLRHPK